MEQTTSAASTDGDVRAQQTSETSWIPTERAPSWCTAGVRVRYTRDLTNLVRMGFGKSTGVKAGQTGVVLKVVDHMRWKGIWFWRCHVRTDLDPAVSPVPRKRHVVIHFLGYGNQPPFVAIEDEKESQ